MPQSVAVLGASTNRSKYSNKAVRAYADKGWTVYPVNPKAELVGRARQLGLKPVLACSITDIGAHSEDYAE